MTDIQPIQWTGDRLRLLDQTRLPMENVVLDIADDRQATQAIREMRVRGAPAIGVTAAYAMALAARRISAHPRPTFLAHLEQAAEEVAAARPTAVNLRWAVERMLAAARALPGSAQPAQALAQEAVRIHQEGIEADGAIAQHGAGLLPERGGVLTHCNTGALATGGRGTALGVVRAAWEAGKRFRVFATETRPLLQGARLTAWELMHLGIPATLVVDSAAGSLMARGLIACAVVGADRIAANGDVANKIGTYTLAVLANEHHIPFYVAAPTSTMDLALASGRDIPIEERRPEEVTRWGDAQVAPTGTDVHNPAFDITPARYVTAIVTELGVARPPYDDSLKLMVGSPGHLVRGL